MKESKFYQENMEEGSVNTRRADVLTVLKARFGKPHANAVKEDIDTLLDSDVLAELLNGAAKCRTVGGFRRLLARKMKSLPTR